MLEQMMPLLTTLYGENGRRVGERVKERQIDTEMQTDTAANVRQMPNVCELTVADFS